jgi:hypothetical protein
MILCRSSAQPVSCALGIKGGAWWKAPKPPNCAEVASVQQLVDELDACCEQLVVVQVSGAAEPGRARPAGL